ncbi:MAG: tetratricopeptide repeat protein [Culturomica sp.]|jgi:tetratricopeptide (TPR) repeat protein|nr:tetratricopeptide repeat protein [Culturomica sp.]
MANTTAVEYLDRGNAYADKGDYDKAIADYDKVIELDPINAVTYHNRGIAYTRKGDYDKAIADYNKAIELDPNTAFTYTCRGIAYAQKGDYNQAMGDYSKAIKLDPQFAFAYTFRGNAFYFNGDYDKAIADYSKAIELNPQYATAYNNRGIAYKNKGYYDQAIADFEGATKLDKNFVAAIQNLNLLENFRAICDKYGINEQKQDYFSVYDTANDIVELLKVTNSNEQNVAYYTQRNVAETLLFEKEGKRSQFRQNSIVTTNDPQEGKTLIEYLSDNASAIDWEYTRSDYQAFVGCFSFNHNSLNQFRLYGKYEGKEGTGVNLVFKDSFFADEEHSSSLMTKNANKGIEAPKQTDLSRPTLYRCIYIDLESHNIISLGHRDILSFYTAYGKEAKEKFNKYQESLTKTLESIVEKFKELEGAIKNIPEDNKWEILTEMLINLRYLVKHCAFKEEQECRIINVEKLDNKDKKIKMDGSEWMYIEAGEVSRHVQKIYFGPCATGIGLFRDRLILEELNEIECEQSRLPFAGK